MARQGTRPAAWFVEAVVPPLLEWKPDWIPRLAGHGEAGPHWQGSPQEQEARDRHARLAPPGPRGRDERRTPFWGMPWSTFLQRGTLPERLLGWWQALGLRDLWLVHPPRSPAGWERGGERKHRPQRSSAAPGTDPGTASDRRQEWQQLRRRRDPLCPSGPAAARERLLRVLAPGAGSQVAHPLRHPRPGRGRGLGFQRPS
jgi:hypothetical protein